MWEASSSKPPAWEIKTKQEKSVHLVAETAKVTLEMARLRSVVVDSLFRHYASSYWTQDPVWIRTFGPGLMFRKLPVFPSFLSAHLDRGLCRLSSANEKPASNLNSFMTKSMFLEVNRIAMKRSNTEHGPSGKRHKLGAIVLSALS